MRPLKSLISLDEAKKIINDNIYFVKDIEEVKITDLSDRVSAENIISSVNVPPFRRAAMDGYAIKSSSTFPASEENPILLNCVEKIHAGEVPTQIVSEIDCIEIATGAMVPDSADTVIQVELTNIVDGKIEIIKPIAPGINVSKEGADIKKEELVIKENQLFTPGRIGALAAMNITSAKVYRKPRVAVIPTGREIAPIKSELKRGQVYDINSYTISTLVRENGGEANVFEIIADEFNMLEEAVLKAASADLIIISGGSSVGERDINIDVIKKHGEILFHGVQIKPGKPTLFGKVGENLVLNLPGYPTSCLTNGYIFMVPLLRKMAHLPIIEKKKIKAKLSKKIVSRLGRHQILTVKVENGIAIPVFKESGAITSMALADGYIEIPYNVDLIDKDEDVEVFMF